MAALMVSDTFFVFLLIEWRFAKCRCFRKLNSKFFLKNAHAVGRVTCFEAHLVDAVWEITAQAC